MRTIPGRRSSTQPLDVYRLSVSGMILVALSSITLLMGPLRVARPSLSLLVVAIVAVALRPRLVTLANVHSGRESRAVLLLLLLACFSAIFGISMGGSFVFLTEFAKVIVLYMLILAGIRSPRDFTTFVWAFVVSMFVLVIIEFTVAETEVTIDGLERLGGQGGFDSNDVGMVLLMGFPLALVTFFRSRFLGRAVSLVVIAGTPLAIALTGSRGSFVGVAVVGLVLFFLLRRISLSRRLAMVVVMAGGLIFGAPEGYWRQMQTIVQPEANYNFSSDYGRMGIASRGVGYMLRYPVFGIGVGNFGRAEGTISPIAKRKLAAGEAVRWIAPHNTYVQIGAETGLVGLGLWLYLLYSGTVGIWKLRRGIPRSWTVQSKERRFLQEACLFLPLSVIAFAVTSFFLSHAYTPPFYILLALVISLIQLVKRELDRDRQLARSVP